MKNKLAKQLKQAAVQYRDVERHSADVEKIVQSDYEDLTSIAMMIENDEKPQSIAKAMWRLDTAVRDVIPDEVYYHFCK